MFEKGPSLVTQFLEINWKEIFVSPGTLGGFVSSSSRIYQEELAIAKASECLGDHHTRLRKILLVRNH